MEPVNVLDNFMKYSINSWTKEWPTKENAGQWFFIKSNGKTFVKEIRVDKDNGSIYICEQCYDGMEKTSYGNPLAYYGKMDIEFCGPIQMPPDFRKS